MRRGTIPGMDDSMDGGGRTVPGATVEEVEPRRRPTGTWEGRATQEQLPRAELAGNLNKI
jgi:hypothetical protein